MGFTVPLSVDNPEGWGPPADCAPAEFADVPYSPFSKSDKLGRAADWTQTGFGKFGGSAWRAWRAPLARRGRPRGCSRASPVAGARAARQEGLGFLQRSLTRAGCRRAQHATRAAAA